MIFSLGLRGHSTNPPTFFSLVSICQDEAPNFRVGVRRDLLAKSSGMLCSLHMGRESAKLYMIQRYSQL